MKFVVAVAGGGCQQSSGDGHLLFQATSKLLETHARAKLGYFDIWLNLSINHTGWKLNYNDRNLI